MLHGIDSITTLAGPRPIQQPKSAVIGLIGCAPIHHVANATALPSTPVLVASDTDRAKLGPDLPGYNIPKALNGSFSQGAGATIVINMFDPTNPAHQTSVASAARNIGADKRIVLPHADLISVTVTTLADAACVDGTDYTVDRVTGIITVKAGGALAAAAQAKVAYIRANPAGVVASDIVGSVSVGGQRLGAQAFLAARALFGFVPKLLIAPGYSSIKSVETALVALAQPPKLRAFVLVDVPLGSTRDQVINGRNTAGALDLTTASNRLVFCYPGLKVNGVVELPSAYVAGIIARTDAQKGVHWSPSNQDVVGASGLELPLSWSLADPDCDLNLLNNAGVLTFGTGYGKAVRTWGNTSSAFPGSSDILTFIAAQRVVDAVDDAIEFYMLQKQDAPINQVLVDAVVEDVNAYLRDLIGRGWIYPGSRVQALPEKNPSASLAAGKVTFTKTLCPPPPAQTISNETVVDTSLLKVSA